MTMICVEFDRCARSCLISMEWCACIGSYDYLVEGVSERFEMRSTSLHLPAKQQSLSVAR